MKPAEPLDMPPVQRPADPAAVGAQMSAMKKAADGIIAEAVEASKASGANVQRLFVEAEGRIHHAMWPAFGPANAWLFGERAGKVGDLRRALGLGDEAVPFATYVASLVEALHRAEDLARFVDGEGGLEVRVLPAAEGEKPKTAFLGPFRGQPIGKDPLLGEVLVWARRCLKAGLVPQLDAKRLSFTLAERGGGELLVTFFEKADRFALAELIMKR